MSHTPGPWTSAGTHIDAPNAGRFGKRICDLVSNDADARLIAASPDLLAVLEVFADTKRWRYDYMWRFYGEDPAEMAAAVVARARG